MSEDLAEAISEAVQPEWNDEQTDTRENLEGFTFPNFNALIDHIMELDRERKNQGWGAGKLVRNNVIAAVKSQLPRNFVYIK